MSKTTKRLLFLCFLSLVSANLERNILDSAGSPSLFDKEEPQKVVLDRSKSYVARPDFGEYEISEGSHRIPRPQKPFLNKYEWGAPAPGDKQGGWKEQEGGNKPRLKLMAKGDVYYDNNEKPVLGTFKDESLNENMRYLAVPDTQSARGHRLVPVNPKKGAPPDAKPKRRRIDPKTLKFRGRPETIQEDDQESTGTKPHEPSRMSRFFSKLKGTKNAAAECFGQFCEKANEVANQPSRFSRWMSGLRGKKTDDEKNFQVPKQPGKLAQVWDKMRNKKEEASQCIGNTCKRLGTATSNAATPMRHAFQDAGSSLRNGIKDGSEFFRERRRMRTERRRLLQEDQQQLSS